MAVYVISDIHGHLGAFKKLLERAQFRYEYSDELHILGDLVDWGPNSIDTVIYVMNLCKKYPFIKCYKGNHDVFLEDAIKNKQTVNAVEHSIWGINGGAPTYSEYLKLDKKKQKEIYEFIKNLPLSSGIVRAGNLDFFMAHAAPEYENGGHVGYEEKLDTATWTRWGWGERSKFMEANHPDALLVTGHTITRNYYKYCKYRECSVLVNLNTLHLHIDCGGKSASTYCGHRLALVNLSDLTVLYSDTDNTESIWMCKDLENYLL